MYELQFIGHLYFGGYWSLRCNGQEVDRHPIRYVLVNGELGAVRTLSGKTVHLTDRAEKVWRTT